MVRDAGASAPGLLGKAAPGHSGSLHGCTVDRAARRRAIVDAARRAPVHVRYMVPDRTLFGRHRLQMPRWIRPPQGAANALWRSRRVLISTHLTSHLTRVGCAWRTRTVPTVSGDAILKALVRLAAHAASAAAQAGARGPWSGRGTGVDRHRARRARGILSLWCIGPARANVMRFR